MSILAMRDKTEIVNRPLTQIGYRHSIVDKDYYRLLSTEKQVNKHQESKRKKRKMAMSQQKFKSRTQLLVEEYQNPNITEDKLYVIDKAVRMRALQGRYGVDHSEVLNFEFE